jgi:hypothetical protein
LEALSGDVLRYLPSAYRPEAIGDTLNPFGSYCPRGTMTSQQSRGWPLLSSWPQPRPGA